MSFHNRNKNNDRVSQRPLFKMMKLYKALLLLFVIMTSCTSFQLPGSSSLYLSSKTLTTVSLFQSSSNMNNEHNDDDDAPFSSSRAFLVEENKITKKNNPRPTSDSRSSTRSRRFILTNSFVTMLTATTTNNNKANAAQGAAEYDFEYYMRDLIYGNKKEGNLPVSQAPPLEKPRTLKDPLLSLFIEDFILYDDDDTTTAVDSKNNKKMKECKSIPILLLAKSIVEKSNNEKTMDMAIAEVRSKVASYANKNTRNAFYNRAPWENASISDQYYFDYISYCVWRTAADILLPVAATKTSSSSSSYINRDYFVRDIGREIYKQGCELGIFTKLSSKGTDQEKLKSNPLTSSIPYVKEILDAFGMNGCQFFSKYKLGGDTATTNTKTKQPKNGGSNNNNDQKQLALFDIYDDEDLIDGNQINCIVSIFNPATLGSALQITGEGSRFAPEFLGVTLLALWEQEEFAKFGIQKGSYETFFVDSVYRPNPKDYFPDEIIYQFTLSL